MSSDWPERPAPPTLWLTACGRSGRRTGPVETEVTLTGAPSASSPKLPSADARESRISKITPQPIALRRQLLWVEPYRMRPSRLSALGDVALSTKLTIDWQVPHTTLPQGSPAGNGPRHEDSGFVFTWAAKLTPLLSSSMLLLPESHPIQLLVMLNRAGTASWSCNTAPNVDLGNHGGASSPVYPVCLPLSKMEELVYILDATPPSTPSSQHSSLAFAITARVSDYRRPCLFQLSHQRQIHPSQPCPTVVRLPS